MISPLTVSNTIVNSLKTNIFSLDDGSSASLDSASISSRGLKTGILLKGPALVGTSLMDKVVHPAVKDLIRNAASQCAVDHNLKLVSINEKLAFTTGCLVEVELADLPVPRFSVPPAI